jgi:bile acid:Na+ symporter, BASS family
METQFITSTLLPLSLAIIMFGFGLSLTIDDFKRVLKYPKSIGIGLFCQMILIPILAFGLIKIFHLSPEMALGLMILAASPGGITANIFSHLSHGDVALNLTLTAINSVLAAFTLPLIIYISTQLLNTDGLSVGLQFSKSLEVFLIVLIPVTIGLFVNSKNPNFSKKVDKPFRIFSMLILVLIITAAIIKEKNTLGDSFAQIGLVVLIFNILSMGVGYGIPLLAQLKHSEATAISMEVGIHNGTLAIYIAMSVLNSFPLALPAAVYSIIMFITAAIFSFILSRKNRPVV